MIQGDADIVTDTEMTTGKDECNLDIASGHTIPESSIFGPYPDGGTLSPRGRVATSSDDSRFELGQSEQTILRFGLFNSQLQSGPLNLPSRVMALGDGIGSIPSQLSNSFSSPSSATTSFFRRSNIVKVCTNTLLGDKEIESLVSAVGLRVGRYEFQEIISLFLEDFGQRLFWEATTSEQSVAARFIRERAADIAKDIVERNIPLETHANKDNRITTTGLNDHPLPYLVLKENVITEFEYFESFVLSSNALIELRESLRSWPNMPEVDTSKISKEAFGRNSHVQDTQPLEHQSVILDEGERTILADTAARTGDWVNDIPSEDDDTSDHEGLKQHTVSVDTQKPHSSIRRGKFERVIGYISLAGYHVSRLFDRGIANGKVRVSWRCGCGKRMRLCVDETRSAAAIKFATQAAGPSNASTVTVASSSSRPSSISSTSASQVQSSPERDTTPLSTPSAVIEDGNFDEPIEPREDVHRYILFCADSGPFHTSLEHINLTHVRDDGILWDRAREAYKRIRARRAQTWSGKLSVAFSKPRHFRFLEFRLEQLSLSGPSVKRIRHPAIPPPEEVKGGNYWFRSYDLEHGDLSELSHCYMHCFINEGDHMANGTAIDSLPKKLREGLCLNERLHPLGSDGRAWGIWIVDGPNYTLLGLYAAMGVFSVTIIACVWSGVMDDVQGGMGIGQYLLAFMTLLGAVTLWQLNPNY